jgi:hypothetical protein
VRRIAVAWCILRFSCGTYRLLNFRIPTSHISVFYFLLLQYHQCFTAGSVECDKSILIAGCLVWQMREAVNNGYNNIKVSNWIIAGMLVVRIFVLLSNNYSTVFRCSFWGEWKCQWRGKGMWKLLPKGFLYIHRPLELSWANLITYFRYEISESASSCFKFFLYIL